MELTVIERLITELTVFFTGRYNTQILSAITQSVTHLTLDTNRFCNGFPEDVSGVISPTQYGELVIQKF